jgi:putative SOS response-associated peptidase YedK
MKVQLYCFPMCGRFRLSRVDKLAERFGIEPEDDWVPRYNIAPTQNIEVIRPALRENCAPMLAGHRVTCCVRAPEPRNRASAVMSVSDGI